MGFAGVVGFKMGAGISLKSFALNLAASNNCACSSSTCLRNLRRFSSPLLIVDS
jgi:hypothetical protein